MWLFFSFGIGGSGFLYSVVGILLSVKPVEILNTVRYDSFAEHLILFFFPLVAIYINKDQMVSEWIGLKYMMLCSLSDRL